MNLFGILIGATALAAIVYFLRRESRGCSGCCVAKINAPPTGENDLAENESCALGENRCDRCPQAAGCGSFSRTGMYKSCSGLAITFPQNCPGTNDESGKTTSPL